MPPGNKSWNVLVYNYRSASGETSLILEYYGARHVTET